MSTDSEPELVKKMRSSPGGASSASRLAQLERDRVAHLECGREIQGRELLRDRLGDFAAAMAGIDAPQSRDAIEDLAAIAGSK